MGLPNGSTVEHRSGPARCQASRHHRRRAPASPVGASGTRGGRIDQLEFREVVPQIAPVTRQETLGVQECLSKPFSPKELLKTIEDILYQRAVAVKN